MLKRASGCGDNMLKEGTARWILVLKASSRELSDPRPFVVIAQGWVGLWGGGCDVGSWVCGVVSSWCSALPALPRSCQK